MKKLVHKIKILIQNDSTLLKLSGNYSLFTHLYLLMFDRTFIMEIKQGYQAKSLYQRQLNQKKCTYQLVRNIHRIEKGLTVNNRKSIFAISYIKETMDLFLSPSFLDIKSEQKKWMVSILFEYFRSCNDPVIDKQKKRFYDSDYVSSIEVIDEYIYDKRKNHVYNDVDYDEYLNLCKQRRSIRTFCDKTVDRDLIDRALSAAKFSPSACNRQPFYFEFVDDKKLINKLFGLPYGTSGFTKEIPMLGILVGDQSAFFDERDRHIPFIDGSLFTMNFINALETMGISSCVVNWQSVKSIDRDLRALISVPNHCFPILFLAIGYADPDMFVAHSVKKEVTQLRNYN